MTPTVRLLARLDRVRPVGGGWWSARCPAHNDQRNSLAVAESDSSRALVTCQAGCSTGAITGAVGLRVSDLFDNTGNGTGHRIVAAYNYTDERGELGNDR